MPSPSASSPEAVAREIMGGHTNTSTFSGISSPLFLIPRSSLLVSCGPQFIFQLPATNKFLMVLKFTVQIIRNYLLIIQSLRDKLAYLLGISLALRLLHNLANKKAN